MKEKLEKGIIKQNFPILRLDTKRFAKTFFSRASLLPKDGQERVFINSFTPYNSLIYKRVGSRPPLKKKLLFFIFFEIKI